MYSGTVVLLFIFVLVGLRAVWYCFLVVSGKNSTVLAVLYCFFNLVYELGNTKTKTKRKSPIQQLVHSSSASAFQSCPSDPMLRSRYKANSRYVSIEAYPFALPCGERIEDERIDACSRAASACWYSPNFRLEKIDFCLVSCTATGGPPQALAPVGALPDHGLGLLRFSL